MAQRNLGKLYPYIEGNSKYGMKYSSFITTDTAFAASAGLSGAAVAGQLRYDTSDAAFKYWNGSAEVAIAAATAAGAGFDEMYDVNPSATVDGSTITFVGSTTNDILQVSSSGNTASGKGLVDLVWTGTPNVNGNMLRLDATGATTSGVPTAIEVVGTGETMRGLYIDTDGTSVGAAAFHSGGALTNGVGVINVTNDGNLAAGGSLLCLTMGGTPADATVAAFEIVASKDCLAMDIISSAATDSAVQITGAGAIANNKALLEIVDTGTAANAGSNVLRIDSSGATATNKNVMVEIVGTGKTVRGLEVDTDIADANVVLINGGGNIEDGLAVLALTADGSSQTAGGCVLTVTNSGTPDADSRLVELVAGGKDMTGIYMDVDSATNHGIYFRNDGNPAAGKAMLYLDLNGDPNATGAMLHLDATGASATNTAYSMQIDNSTTDMGAINIDADNVTDHTVHIHCGGALADNKAILNLSADGTLAAGTANYLRIDASGATSTNNPTGIEIVGAGETMQGIYTDTDGTSAHQNLFHGGGALTNGLGVVGITNDGNLAAGGNLLNVTMGGTPADETACAVEIVAAKDCQALAVATSAATASGIVFTGSGATADDTAVFEVNWGSSTPANAGSNLVRIDGSGATNTVKPVLLEVYDDSVAVGLVIDTASIEDVVSITGSGDTGSTKSVVDIVWGAVTPNAAGNLLRLDATAATTTNVPTALEIVGTGETMRGIYVDTDITSKHANLFHCGGALTDGFGVVGITNDGNLAAGGSMLQLTMGGTPADETVVGLEVLVAKNCLAATFAGSPTTGNMIEMSSNAVTAAGMATLAITGTGTIADGSYYMDITTGANGASSTASYLLHLDAAHTNIEALHVDAGKVLIDETLTVTAGAEITADAGIGNWTVDAATATSDGATTGVIPDNVNCVQITSTNTDYWCTLPAPTPGKEVWIIADATSACELRSSAPTTVYINNVVGAGCELTITADTTYHALCINATNWIVEKYDNAGAPTGGGTPN